MKILPALARGSFESALQRCIVGYWARKYAATIDEVRAGEPKLSSLTDFAQQTMNLVMPLQDPATAAPQLAHAMSAQKDALFASLDTISNVHFARFDLIDGNLCMLSVYDGTFDEYIKNFISAIGDIFNVIMGFVIDPPPVPVQDNPAEFIEWVRAHDLLKVPSPLELTDDIEKAKRLFVVLCDRVPNMELGVYRGYSGSGVQEIRQALNYAD